MVPAWALLVLLPVVWLASQWVGAIAQGIALAAVRATTGVKPPINHPVGMLAGMGVGALLLTAVALLVPLLCQRSVREQYRLAPAPIAVLVAAGLGTVALGPLADVLMVWMQQHFPDATLGALPRLHELAQAHSFALLWPFFALLPGLSEELFFRGLVQTTFAHRGLAIGVSALSFAAFHADPHHVVGVFPLGLFLAWVASRHGAWVTTVAHVANNSVALLTIQVSQLDVGYGTEVPMPAWWVAIGLAVWAACAYALARPPS